MGWQARANIVSTQNCVGWTICTCFSASLMYFENQKLRLTTARVSFNHGGFCNSKFRESGEQKNKDSFVVLFCEILSKMALDKCQRLQNGGTHLPVCQGWLFYPRWRWISGRWLQDGGTHLPVCLGCLFLSKMALAKRQRLQDGGTHLPICRGCLFLSKMALAKRQRLQDGGTHLPVCQGCLLSKMALGKLQRSQEGGTHLPV